MLILVIEIYGIKTLAEMQAKINILPSYFKVLDLSRYIYNMYFNDFINRNYNWLGIYTWPLLL